MFLFKFINFWNTKKISRWISFRFLLSHYSSASNIFSRKASINFHMFHVTYQAETFFVRCFFCCLLLQLWNYSPFCGCFLTSMYQSVTSMSDVRLAVLCELSSKHENFYPTRELRLYVTPFDEHANSFFETSFIL